MKRRLFLKGFFGGSAAIASGASIASALPLNEETFADACKQFKGKNLSASTGGCAEALWPGVNEFYGKSYADKELEPFKKRIKSS